jgi:hypothetical protein
MPSDEAALRHKTTMQLDRLTDLSSLGQICLTDRSLTTKCLTKRNLVEMNSPLKNALTLSETFSKHARQFNAVLWKTPHSYGNSPCLPYF